MPHRDSTNEYSLFSPPFCWFWLIAPPATLPVAVPGHAVLSAALPLQIVGVAPVLSCRLLVVAPRR